MPDCGAYAEYPWPVDYSSMLIMDDHDALPGPEHWCRRARYLKKTWCFKPGGHKRDECEYETLYVFEHHHMALEHLPVGLN